MKNGSEIYWTSRAPHRCCFTPVKSHSGTITNFAWIPDSQEVALSLKFPYQIVVDCKEEFIISQLGYAATYNELIPLMKVPKLIDRLKPEVNAADDSYRNVTVRYVQRIIQSGMLTSEQIAAELTVVSPDVRRSVSFTFRHNLRTICSQINSVARQLHFAVAAQPVLASRHLLNVSDIHARYALTGVLKVWPCAPVSNIRTVPGPTSGSLFRVLRITFSTMRSPLNGSVSGIGGATLNVTSREQVLTEIGDSMCTF